MATFAVQAIAPAVFAVSLGASNETSVVLEQADFRIDVGENTVQAAASAASAVSAAAVAESVAGPSYASTAAGLAATSNGETFAVDNGDGTVSVYSNNGGSAVFERSLATSLALASQVPGEGRYLIGEPSVSALLSSAAASRGVGATWYADGYRYIEAASGATDHHITTAGGVKLYVVQGQSGYPVAAFGGLSQAVSSSLSPLALEGGSFAGVVIDDDVSIVGPGTITSPFTIQDFGVLRLTNVKVDGNVAAVAGNATWSFHFDGCEIFNHTNILNHGNTTTIEQGHFFNCTIRDGEQGIYYRAGTVGDISVRECKVKDIAAPSGQSNGVNVHGIAVLATVSNADSISFRDNVVEDITSPYSASDTNSETSGIMCNAAETIDAQVVIADNEVRRVANVDGASCQGIYTKIPNSRILRNELLDAGGDQGSINIKSPAANTVVEGNTVQVSAGNTTPIHGIVTFAQNVMPKNNTLIGVTGYNIVALGNFSDTYDHRILTGNVITNCRGRVAIYANLPDRGAVISGNTITDITNEFSDPPAGLNPTYRNGTDVYGVVVAAGGLDNMVVNNSIIPADTANGIGVAVIGAQTRTTISCNHIAAADAQVYLGSGVANANGIITEGSNVTPAIIDDSGNTNNSFLEISTLV